jgi:hemerythrin
MNLELLTQVPQTALAFINDDHREELALLRIVVAALEDRVQGDVDDTEVTRAWEALTRHTSEHFAREELSMKEVSFPASAVHQAEHQRVLAEMEVKYLAWRAGGDVKALLAYASEGISSWFVSHVQTMDFVTARFVIAARGA